MKIIKFKKASFPKFAVLATGVAAALLVATMNPTPAQAFPGSEQDCTNCHGGGVVSGTVTAVPSLTTLVVNGSYTVLITPPATPAMADTGYWIANSNAAGATLATTNKNGGGFGNADPTYTVSMTAPSTPGTYYYKVWADRGPRATGSANFALYSIIVTAVPTTTTTPVTTTTTTPTTTTTTTPTTTTTTTTGIFRTSSYIASTRVRTAVYIHTLIHEYNSATGVMSSPAGRVSYLQRYNAGVWQNLISRTSDSTGRWTVGFIQPKVFQYRIVTIATASAGAATSGSTFR